MQKPTALLAALLLVGCGQMPDLPTLISPHKIDIQQGNVLTQEMVAKLKPGMTRAQVHFVLGSPLIVDPFRTDRWDYVYTFQRQGKLTETRRIIVVFQDEKLLRIEGDVAPQDSSAQSVQNPVAKPPVTGAPAPVAAPVKPAVTPPDGAGPGAKADAAPVTGVSNTQTANPDAAPAKPDAPKEEPKEEKGFFGRMLDKIGF